jgi:hypothetical protein
MKLLANFVNLPDIRAMPGSGQLYDQIDKDMDIETDLDFVDECHTLGSAEVAFSVLERDYKFKLIYLRKIADNEYINWKNAGSDYDDGVSNGKVAIFDCMNGTAIVFASIEMMGPSSIYNFIITSMNEAQQVVNKEMKDYHSWIDLQLDQYKEEYKGCEEEDKKYEGESKKPKTQEERKAILRKMIKDAKAGK